MTPREYLRTFRYDARLTTGSFVSQEPLQIDDADTVGVVLLSEGGPAERGDVERFLYERYMDPAAFELPVRGVFRHQMAKMLSRVAAPRVGRGYEMIGGASPIIRHTKDQSRALQAVLNHRLSGATDATFRVYIAMRHGPLRTEGAVRRMVADGVTKVIMVPMHPQYSSTTTGSALAYWDALERTGRIPHFPSALVPEYSTHPHYVRALRDRVEEGLQRFPRDERSRIPVVFVAPTPSRRAHARSNDPYCCLVHATVADVLEGSAHPERTTGVAFHSEMVPGRGIEPDLEQILEELADGGHTDILIVPIGGICDHVDTAYGLDVAVRARAIELGFTGYEVASSLNCHPLLIQALADTAMAAVDPASLPGVALPVGPAADLAASSTCGRCGRSVAPRAWSIEPLRPVVMDPDAPTAPSRAA